VVIATFIEGAVLTLVFPLAVLIAVAVWYVRMWRGDMGDQP
jgi:hypothetical protein